MIENLSAPEVTDALPQRLRLAFAPVHKRAFGVAVGTAAGLGIFAITVLQLILPGESGLNLWLLGEYFFGYSPTPWGALVGLSWGFVVGFVAGWFVAFCRNFVIAVLVFLSRTRHELAATRDFLDHV